jgi:lipid-A-disaccharide synthase-like uncharacterized protein
VHLLPILAFQVWDAVGWAGQGVFTWRMLHQWWSSEQARRSVLPLSFWWWSLAGTLLLLVYQLHRTDGIFLAGVLVNGALYARNLRIATRPRPAGVAAPGPWAAFAFAAVALTALSTTILAGGARVDWNQPPAWLVVGIVGQVVWSSRFVLQWWISERRGESVLPASFFVLSIVGSVVLCVYAVHRKDYVMIAAYALNPIPYGRNLALIARARRTR